MCKTYTSRPRKTSFTFFIVTVPSFIAANTTYIIESRVKYTAKRGPFSAIVHVCYQSFCLYVLQTTKLSDLIFRRLFSSESEYGKCVARKVYTYGFVRLRRELNCSLFASIVFIRMAFVVGDDATDERNGFPAVGSRATEL